MKRHGRCAVLSLLLAVCLAASPLQAREEAAKALCLDDDQPSEARIAACTRYLRGAQPPPAEQVPILRARSDAYSELDRWEEALADLDAALAISPDDAALWRQRGLTYEWKGDREQALADYERAIELEPDNLWSHYARANVLRALGRYEEALEAYDQALLIDPTYSSAIDGRAGTLERLGRYAEAYDGFRRALEIRPYSAWLNVRAASLARRLAQPFAAFRHYYLALLLDPNSESASYGLDELGVDRARSLPATPRALTPRAPAAGLVLHFLQQEIDPAAEVEVDPMEEAIMGLVGWFAAPARKPEPISSLFVSRQVELVEGNLALVRTAPSFPARDAASKVTEPQARFLWGLWPAAFVTPQGGTGPEIRYGEALEQVWTLAANQSVTGNGDVVVTCPAEGVQADLIQALVGCDPAQPGQVIGLGTVSWTATNVGWESVLLPAGRMAALRLHYIEDSEITLMGKTKERHLELTWWWSPELDWWVKRRLVKDKRIEVTQLVRLGE